MTARQLACAAAALAAACGEPDPLPTPPTTTVGWRFNADPVLLPRGDNCNDLGVSRVRVELTGPTQSSGEATCTAFEVKFRDLPPGRYRAEVTPLDRDGASLVHAPVVADVDAGDDDLSYRVVVPWTSWLYDRPSNFYFRIRWGGLDCADAVPPVATQTLALTVKGSPVAAATDSDQKLDGVDRKPCRPAADQFPQTVVGIPFGPAVLEVVGYDPDGVERYRQSFDTFIGAGKSNDEREFDLEPPPAPDAGVDAAPADAAPKTHRAAGSRPRASRSATAARSTAAVTGLSSTGTSVVSRKPMPRRLDAPPVRNMKRAAWSGASARSAS